MKYGEIEVRRRKFEVFINEDGRFYTSDEGQTVRRDTLKELIKALSYKVKRKKLNIPFVEAEHDWRGGKIQIRRGVVVGFGQRQGYILLEYSNGEKVCGRMDPGFLAGDTDVKELIRLHKESESMRAKYEAFMAEHQLKLEWKEGEEE